MDSTTAITHAQSLMMPTPVIDMGSTAPEPWAGRGGGQSWHRAEELQAAPQPVAPALAWWPVGQVPAATGWYWIRYAMQPGDSLMQGIMWLDLDLVITPGLHTMEHLGQMRWAGPIPKPTEEHAQP